MCLCTQICLGITLHYIRKSLSGVQFTGELHLSSTFIVHAWGLTRNRLWQRFVAIESLNDLSSIHVSRQTITQAVWDICQLSQSVTFLAFKNFSVCLCVFLNVFNSVCIEKVCTESHLPKKYKPNYTYFQDFLCSGVSRICCEEGQIWKNYVMGHSRWTSRPDAAAARWLIVLWLIKKAVS